MTPNSRESYSGKDNTVAHNLYVCQSENNALYTATVTINILAVVVPLVTNYTVDQLYRSLVPGKEATAPELLN